MRILLVEDNHLFGEYIGAHIENVTAVDSLAAALETLNRERFDLLLIDLGLPDSRGVDTLHAFSGFKTPKIVITVTDRHLKETAQLGACDYILKGNPREMIERIQFNLNKLARKRLQFAPEVFEVLKGCFQSHVPELALA